MNIPKTLSVVFSFRNEEDVLSLLIQRTRSSLKLLVNTGVLSAYELIFVNDHSSDNSLSILLKHAEGHNDLRIINMSRTFGVSPCVMAGFSYARSDMIAYMDADLQDPPELLPKLIKVMQEKKADVVHTVRDARKGESPLKLWITSLGYWILNKISNINLPKETGDFKLLSRRAVNHVLRLREHRPFMRGLICWIGFNQEFITYTRDPRQAGKTKFSIFGRDVISNFLNSALISFSSAPLRIAYLFGLIAILVDFLLVLHVCYEKFSGKAIPGWTAIMIAILFLNGIQLFCIGIMGLYIHSTYEQTKQRPSYIIESIFGFSQNLPEDNLPSTNELLNGKIV